MKEEIPYLMASIPLLVLFIAFSYLRYRKKAKKYVRIFKRTLIKNGIPRNMASKLSSQIKIWGIRDLLQYQNFRRWG